MMKTITSFLSKAVLAIAGIVAFSSTAYAQVSWKGSDVTTLTSSDKFYLYNVGTGKFVIAGGQWGTQAMMRYTTVGTRMHLLNAGSSSTNQIVSNLQASTDASNAVYLGVNYVDWTTVGAWNEKCSKTLGVFLEAQTSVKVGSNSNTTSRNLTFTKVSGDETNGYTYTITENMTRGSNSKTMKLGAGWGFDVTTGTDGSVLQRDFVAFTEKTSIDDDYEKLYQWKFVTLKEMMDYYMRADLAEYGTFNANASYLLSDPFFERGNTDFSAWNTSSTASGDTYRYNWFASTTEKDSTSGGVIYERSGSPWINSATTTDQPWDTFVFKKLEFNSKTYGPYTYAIVEGKGSATQSFTVPEGGAGVIELLAVGFFNGPEANAPSITISTSAGETATVKLKTADYTKYQSGQDTLSSNWLAGVVGKTIYENKNEAYTVSASVYANVGDVVTVTISKPGATQSAAITSGRNSYYYDTDFTAIDHVAIHYLGPKVFSLEDDRTSDSYMRNLSEETGKNVTTLLARSFTVGEWNSLVLPVNVTSAVARDAFGDSVKIAELSGVGTESNGQNSLDFKSVDLDKVTTAIQAGHVYLIKPIKEPVARTYKSYKEDGTQSTTETVTKDTYNLGIYSLNGENLPDMDADSISSDNRVKAHGTFIKLENGCPAGSYVYRKGDVYHLQSDMTIKGFRAWFEDITPEQKGISNSVKFDGGEITGLNKIISEKKATGNIYTVDGVVVRVGATSLENLPAGTYIFNGKKYLVK